MKTSNYGKNNNYKGIMKNRKKVYLSRKECFNCNSHIHLFLDSAERNTEADAQGAPSELIGTSELQCPPGHIEMGDGLRVVTLKQMKLSTLEIRKGDL